MSRGKGASNITKPAEEAAENMKGNIIPKIKMNDEAKKIYSEISEQCNAKINVEISDKKSESLKRLAEYFKKTEFLAAVEKDFTGIKTWMNNTSSPILYTFENGKLVKKSEKFDEYDETITTIFDPLTGKRVSRETSCSGDTYLEIFNPETGLGTSYLEGSKDYFFISKYKYVDGKQRRNSGFIQEFTNENFDEIANFHKKFDSLSDDEIKNLYRQKLQNPEGVSDLEFKMLMVNHNFRFCSNPVFRNNYFGKVDLSDMDMQKVNSFVNGEMKYTPQVEALRSLVEKVDRTFATSKPLRNDTVLYNMMPLNHPIINGKAGEVVALSENGYYRANPMPKWPKRENSDAMIVIYAPKGSKVLCAKGPSSDSPHYEDYGYFPRGANFKILSKGKSPEGANIIELEYILPDGV